MAKREVKIKVKVDAKDAVKGTEKVSEGFKKVDKSAGKAKTSVGGFGDGLGAVGGGLATAAAGAGKLLTSFKALILSPVGMVIAAIAVALLAVKTAFESSEEGQNKFNMFMGVLGALLGNLMDLLADFGEMIIEAFENPQRAIKKLGSLIKQNLVNRFNGLLELIPQMGKAIKQLFSGDFVEAGKTAANALVKVSLGVDNITDKLKKATEASKEFLAEQVKEGKQAAAVAGMRAKADKIERKLLVQKSILQSKIAQLRLKARQEDQFSAAERREALIEAQGFENTLLDKTTEYLTLRAKAQTLENTFSRSNKENLTKEATAIAAVNNQIAVRANVARALQRELNTIAGQIKTQNAQEAAAEKKKTDAALKLEAEQLATNQRKLQADIDLKLLRAELGLEDEFASKEERAILFAEKIAAMEAEFTLEAEIRKAELIKKGASDAELRSVELLNAEIHQNNLREAEEERIEGIAKLEADKLKEKQELEKLVSEGIVDTTQQVLGDVSKLMGEGSKEAKAIALAQATISGIQGVQAAFTSGSAVPIVGVALGPIAAIAAGAVAAKNISQIASSKTGSKHGGGSTGGGSFRAPSIPTASLSQTALAPELREDSLFSTQTLEGNDPESIGGGRGSSQRVYVLESDITNAQGRINTVESNSEIG